MRTALPRVTFPEVNLVVMAALSSGVNILDTEVRSTATPSLSERSGASVMTYPVRTVLQMPVAGQCRRPLTVVARPTVTNFPVLGESSGQLQLLTGSFSDSGDFPTASGTSIFLGTNSYLPPIAAKRRCRPSTTVKTVEALV